MSGEPHCPVLGAIGDKTVAEETLLSFTAAATDADLPANTLTYSLVGAPTGAATDPSTGAFTWTPTEAQGAGEYTFTVKVCDNGTPSLCDEEEITVTVTEVNTAPSAQDQTVTTPEDTPIDITLVASDPEEDPLTVIIVDQPLHGDLTINGLVVTYTPDLNYYGADSFTYKVNDGTVDSNEATVSITIAAVNDAPMAEDIEAETDEETPVDIELLASDVDGDELTFTVVTQPAHGTLSGTAPALTYTPEANYNGTDSFTYKASDGLLDSNIATVTITVGAINDEPIAVDDEYDAWMGVTLEVPAPGVLANDIDPDPSDEQTVEVKGAPLHGVLVLNPDGSFTYEPDAGFYGVDTFTYWMISEPGVQSAYTDWATVTITVRPQFTIFLPIIVK